MTNQPTDTDSYGPIPIGVGGGDRKVTNIYDAQPNWVADGYGVRGPQRATSDERAYPREMELGPGVGDPSVRPPVSSGETCNPGEGADDSIKYIKATQWNSGESRWECVWLPTCEGVCETP